MPRTAIYCRISRDPSRDDVGLQGAGVKRQELDCRGLAERLELEVVEVYTDNDIGASTLSTKPRPAYTRMMADARSGKFERILAYSNSRITRRLAGLQELVDLFNQTGIVIQTVVSGDDNLSTADGRMVAAIKASVDQAEAERTSERLKASHRHRALQGRVWKGGRRPFGWSPDYKTLDPIEAVHLEEAVKQVLRGVAITSIAKKWNAAGIRTPAGKEWNYQALQTVLSNPRLCGWVTYHKEALKDEEGNPIMGEWEPLITVELYEALIASIEKRQTPKRRFGKYLLTPFLRCGKCSGVMWGVMRSEDEPYYRCHTGHLSITAPKVEHYVRTATFVHLSECGGGVALEQAKDWVGEARLTEVGSKIQELMDAYNSGRVSGDILLPQVEKLDAERKTLNKERDSHYREQLAEKAPTLVEELPKNVDFLTGETEWLEEWEDIIQEEYDWDGWQALLRQHCRTIFIKPYQGPHTSVTARISILWDNGDTHGEPQTVNAHNAKP